MSQDAPGPNEANLTNPAVTAGAGAGDLQTPPPPLATGVPPAGASASTDYDEFEIGEHKVPWFLWLFFTLIVSWASVSWIQFFGY